LKNNYVILKTKNRLVLNLKFNEKDKSCEIIDTIKYRQIDVIKKNSDRMEINVLGKILVAYPSKII
jgi:hypothetical protein